MESRSQKGSLGDLDWGQEAHGKEGLEVKEEKDLASLQSVLQNS